MVIWSIDGMGASLEVHSMSESWDFKLYCDCELVLDLEGEDGESLFDFDMLEGLLSPL